MQKINRVFDVSSIERIYGKRLSQEEIRSRNS